LGTGGKADGK